MKGGGGAVETAGGGARGGLLKGTVVGINLTFTYNHII